MRLGRIHSAESFGTVDGPGVRYVLFMQGCPLRCIYCHNPDTWSMNGGREISAAEVISEYERNQAFYKNGGLTVTGGEPLVQVDFLIELFSMAKERGIHTCIDTSGITYNPNNAEYVGKLDRLMELTDLVMLDIKHIDPETHKKMTGADNKRVLGFARYLAEKNVPLWVRHVVVKGYTDGAEDLGRLGEFLSTLKNLKALDVLPYHTMGVGKYEDLGMEYPLKGEPALSIRDAERAKRQILLGMKNAHAKRT